VLIAGLYLFFGRTLYGKALRATAINRTGARLMGIGTSLAGKLSFTLAAGSGALLGHPDRADHHDGYYDTGFLVGLKGFVAPSSAAWPATRWRRPAPSWSACSNPIPPTGPAPTRK
jgi:branched-subunit amino acid ABC-type transport system permease component